MLPLPHFSPSKAKEYSENGGKGELIINSPLYKNNITISVKREDGYQSKWEKSRKNNKNQPFANMAEKNLVGENRSSSNEFTKGQKNTVTNNFFMKNGENPKNIKSLEAEINKVLNKLNEISESIKSPVMSMK